MGSLSQIIRYILVGFINTIVSFIVVATLVLHGDPAVIANAAGFAVGVPVSFILNGRLTFQTRRNPIATFVVAFVVCYILNVFVLVKSGSLASIHVLAPQVLALASYNISFFLLLKYWVFSGSKGEDKE